MDRILMVLQKIPPPPYTFGGWVCGGVRLRGDGSGGN